MKKLRHNEKLDLSPPSNIKQSAPFKFANNPIRIFASVQAAAYLVKMIRTVLIAIFLACGAESCRMVVKTLTVSGSNGWGDWGQVQYCIEGSYVTGFRLKVNGLLSRTINQNSNNFSETTALK